MTRIELAHREAARAAHCYLEVTKRRLRIENMLEGERKAEALAECDRKRDLALEELRGASDASLFRRPNPWDYEDGYIIPGRDLA